MYSKTVATGHTIPESVSSMVVLWPLCLYGDALREIIHVLFRTKIDGNCLDLALPFP